MTEKQKVRHLESYVMILPRWWGLGGTVVEPNDTVISTSGLFERQRQIVNPRIIFHFFTWKKRPNTALKVYSLFVEYYNYCPPQDRNHIRRQDLASPFKSRHYFCWPKTKKIWNPRKPLEDSFADGWSYLVFLLSVFDGNFSWTEKNKIRCGRPPGLNKCIINVVFLQSCRLLLLQLNAR